MSGSNERPLVVCPDCARHVKRGSGQCPFCGGGAGRFAKAAVVAAFFGAAAIPGCAYGPGPDDFDSDDTSVSADADDDGADGAEVAPDTLNVE